jgi:ribonuclease HI
MSAPDVLTIHTDGAARGNPGPAAFAYVIAREGTPPIEEAGCLGRMTNNQAEYTALVRALEHAARLGTGHTLLIHSDSELLVKQMRGEYRVKNEELRELYEQARALSKRFAEVHFQHVRRALNRRADELCNEALDGKRDQGTSTVAKRPAAEPRVSPQQPAEQPDAVREDAVACLRAAAAAWARGNAANPDPAQVWDQLWSILEENGALRRRGGR